jgi:hypothetical protein
LLKRIGAKRLDDCHELNEVNTALATLVLGYKGLWFSYLFSQGLLANARFLPHCDKSRNEPGIFGRFQGLLHAPPRPKDLAAGNLIPKKDYPKTGYFLSCELFSYYLGSGDPGNG